MGVALGKKRGLQYESDIPYDPDSLYRALGDEGLDAVMRDRAISPGEKFAAKGRGEVFYSKGYPEAEYVSGNRAAIAEVRPSNKLIHGPSTNPKLPQNYYYSSNATGPVDLDDRVRIWARDVPSGAHKVVYDNITPWKYGARVLARAAGPVGALATAWEGVDALNERARELAGDPDVSFRGLQETSPSIRPALGAAKPPVEVSETDVAAALSKLGSWGSHIKGAIADLFR